MEVKQLKPLSTANFIQTMNILFKELDNRVECTTANYKFLVPDILKRFEYVGPVNSQMMNTGNFLMTDII